MPQHGIIYTLDDIIIIASEPTEDRRRATTSH